MTGRASVSSSFHNQWTYDVFLNFRGEDTRHGFTGNLYRALNLKGVRVFFDDDEIRKGDEIKPALLKAILESRMAITVFSKDYASSTFCLDELVQIHQCIKAKGRQVWPIFYHVEPSEVRHQKGNFKQALAMHKQNLRANEEKMQNWKHALHEIADLSGVHINPGHGYEYQFIDRISKEISSIINKAPLHVAEYPVGLDSRQQKIDSLLQVGSNDKVIMVGICGIGGIGKTTITRAVYNSIADDFEGLCFLRDIKEQSKKIGIEQMQERMLSKILGVKIKIEDIYEGVVTIKERLKQKKILLILDNADRLEQLQNLAGHIDWFRSGSRIIITTRDKHLLLSHGVERIYYMEELNYKESLELLSWSAFKNNHVDPSYNRVLKHVIRYAQGLPLALEVIGSHLFGMTISEWESALDVFKRIPIKDIQQILKVSYDGLQEVEKEIFLDIACFFKRKSLEYVKNLVEHVHGFDTIYNIRVLVDKCLIKIEDNCIEMHDLIQDMGKEIVRQESPKEPGERSRLWFYKDIVDVLEGNNGTKEVSIMILDDLPMKIEVNWDGEAFKKMENLKILIFENLKFSEGTKYLPNSLKVLKWRGYPSSSLPHDFHPKELVVFEMGDSHLNSLETIKKMSHLSVLNLERCEYITHIPDFSGLSNLKKITVGDCRNLIEIHESVGELAKLELLNVYSCTQLKVFPHGIKLPSLEDLSLEYCPSLKYFPEILENGKLRSIHLYGTGIEKLPWSICNLTKLTSISIKWLYKTGPLVEVPSSFLSLPELTLIQVRGCVMLPMEVSSTKCQKLYKLYLKKCCISDEMLRMYLTSFVNIRELYLTASNITMLPACIKECRFLWKLGSSYCKHLREVEGIPPNIKHFYAFDCISMSSKSRNLLLSEELLGPISINHSDYTNIICFCVPGASIPKWFDHHSKGHSISFWFRTVYFPTLYVCALVGPYSYQWSSYKLLINEKLVCRYGGFRVGPTSEGSHIIFFDIQRKHLKEALQGEWNHAQVIIYSRTYPVVVKGMGIKVIKEDSKMEDIRFSHPYQSLDFMSVVEQEKVSSLKASKQIIWRQFDDGWCKINVDGATSNSKGNLGACGVVCRDAKGGFLYGFMCNLGFGYSCSSLYAQLWACYYGLKSAWEWGITTLVLETDSIEVKDILLNRVVYAPEVQQVLIEIRQVISRRSWKVKVSRVRQKANFEAHNLAIKALSMVPGIHNVSSRLMDDIRFAHPLDSMNVEQDDGENDELDVMSADDQDVEQNDESDYMSAKDQEKVRSLKACKQIIWRRPDNGWYKMNVDGVTSNCKNLKAAYGGVCRDAKGGFVYGFMHNIGIIGDPHSSLHAQLWGCLLGLKSAWERGIPTLVLEMNFIEVEDILLRRDVECHSEEQLILEIRELISRSCWQVKISWVPWEANFAAHNLAKKALSVHPGFHLVTSLVPPMEDIQFTHLLDSKSGEQGGNNKKGNKPKTHESGKSMSKKTIENSNNPQKKFFKGICHYWKKRGHRMVDCYKPKAKLEKQGAQKQTNPK